MMSRVRLDYIFISNKVLLIICNLRLKKNCKIRFIDGFNILCVYSEIGVVYD